MKIVLLDALTFGETDLSGFDALGEAEVYQTTSRTGTPIGTSKASYWKAGYHSIELGYYIYLYAFNHPTAFSTRLDFYHKQYSSMDFRLLSYFRTACNL